MIVTDRLASQERRNRSAFIRIATPFEGPDFAAGDPAGRLMETNDQREQLPDNELSGSTRSKGLRTSFTGVTLPIRIQCRQHPAGFQPRAGWASRASGPRTSGRFFAVCRIFPRDAVSGKKRKAVSPTGKTHGLFNVQSLESLSQTTFLPASLLLEPWLP